MNRDANENLSLPYLSRRCFERAVRAAGEEYSPHDPACESIEDTARDYFNEAFGCAVEIRALEVLYRQGEDCLRRIAAPEIPPKLRDDQQKIRELLADDYERLHQFLDGTRAYFGRTAAVWLRGKFAADGFYFDDDFTMRGAQPILPLFAGVGASSASGQGALPFV